MAVMLIATVPGDGRQQQPMYEQLGDRLTRQEGFLFHAAGPCEDGWRLYEAWETREQLQAWLDGAVFPNIPEGAPQPATEIVPLEVVLRP